MTGAGCGVRLMFMSTTASAIATPRVTTTERPVVACYRGLDSAHAVQFGALLADALGVPLALACAYRYEPVGLSARAQRPDNARRARAAQAIVRDARGFAGTDVELREHTVPADGIVGALVALTRDIDAGILVLGRDTRGHITRSLVPRTSCPVVVVPPTVPLPRSSPLERIGVAYDGSSGARTALVAARQLALATGARLILLTAGETTEHATTLLHGASSLLDDAIDADPRVLVGAVPGALVHASGELDLLVCGSRGRSRRLAAILGSVSAHLIGNAHCPVLVVPPIPD